MSNILKNRMEFVFLIEAKMCNHNGDPDMANLPRQDGETDCGIFTDVAIKRRIRNYILDAFQGIDGMDILMKQGTSINKKIAEAVFATSNVGKENKSTAAINNARMEMCRRYWDVRTFGGVLSTGLNAGQVRGAVQIGMSTSLDPIHIEDLTITRMCYTTDGKDYKTIEDYEKEENEREDDKKRTMGEKKIESYGLYVIKGSISAALAEKCGFTEEDANALFEAILQCYNHDISSSKMGMNVISPVIIFKHVGTQNDNNQIEKAREAKLGCAPAYKLFDLLEIRKQDDVEFPRDKKDYLMLLHSSVPKGVEIGIKANPFEPVLWGWENISHEDMGCIQIHNDAN